MSFDRRVFLKAAGLGVLAVGSGEVLRRAFAAGPDAYPRLPPGALEAGKWALLFDTTRCKASEGCKDCQIACHQAHNVPSFDDKRHEVKWIWNEPTHNVFPDTGNEFTGEQLTARPIPVLCNQCDNPPCVRACPTKSTWKRGDGIVMMDWHRCIGCRFCMVACPYGSRSFNWRDPRGGVTAHNPEFPTRTKGVVEKCNLCEERLALGQLPACIGACRHKAILLGDLSRADSEIRRILHASRALRRKAGLGTLPKVFYLV